MDKRRAEQAEARRQAEAARKAQAEAKKKQPRVCTPSPNHEIAGFLPCALAPGDFVVDTTPPDPTRP